MIYVLSGGEKLRSVIAVTYPEGSICTCGGKTARDTSGYALFNVKSGTYTVECHTSDNSKSKSTSVTVTESDIGKAINVTLTYELYLYKNGDKCTDVGGNWSFSKKYTKGASISYGTDKVTINLKSVHMDYMGVCFWYKKIDITNYSKLCMLVTYNSATSATQGICVCKSVPNNPMTSGNYDARLLINGSSNTVPYELDISSITGSKYIGYGASMAGTNSGAVQIKEVYLV